jgi:preprotein translocase subunit SecG
VQQFLNFLLYLLVAATSLFLICLVLIQRGKGGGLAGAFGGAGGSSAFGTKAGDVFTRVTMITAAIWIALNMLLVVVSNRRTSAWGTTSTSASKSEKSDVVPPNPVPAKPGSGTQTIELPPAGLPEKPKDTKPKSDEPAVPISGGSPAAPVPLPDAPKPTPK